jgi:hypothetical protein
LAELEISEQRVRRAAELIGRERVAERAAEVVAFQTLTLPEQRQCPEQVPPVPSSRVAVVEMDGGRIQERDRIAPERNTNGTFWRETKVGVLMTMHSKTQTADPAPQLPEVFLKTAEMRKIAREIKGFTTSHEAATSTTPITAVEVESLEAKAVAQEKVRNGRPEPLVKSVVVTRENVDAFGPMLASAAHARGFHAAERKAFVADGSSTNWGVWEKYFSHYTPITDFIHALMYVYAAAMAAFDPQVAWAIYCEWAQWLWSGEVDKIIAALEVRQLSLGVPEKNETGTPRAELEKSLTYLRNQCGRMKYNEYRQQGLPITSCHVESTVKQVNKRMKGSEKFWSSGGEPLLSLVADDLCETSAVEKFWQRRQARTCCNQPL